MGLDMYLIRQRSFGGFDTKVQSITAVVKNGEKTKTVKIDNPKSPELKEDMAYWRKANMVHAFLTDKNNEGITRVNGDVWTQFDVGVLGALQAKCKQVLKVAKIGKAVISYGVIHGQNIWEDCEGELQRYEKVLDKDGNWVDITPKDKVKASELKVGDIVEAPADDSGFAQAPFYEWTKEFEFRGYKVGEGIVNSEEVAKILPTQDGFFFGSTDYDEYYLEDIKDTIEKLAKVLAEHDMLLAEGVPEYCISYEYIASY